MGGTLARILIVDDHSPARSLIRAIVRLDGHSVSEAGSGEEALAALAGERFDLMILDLVMPSFGIAFASFNTRGYDTVASFHVNPRKSRKRNLLAGCALERFVDCVPDIKGALDHLSKPFGYDEMEKSIKRVLDATPEEIIEIRLNRLAQVETYKKVISLVDEANEPVRRGFFRRVRSVPR